MPDNPHLMDEKNIPANWQPVEAPSPVGAPAPPVPHDMPQYFSGSLPPVLQHDTTFVATEMDSPRIPKTSLMPLGNQGNPFTNAATQSTALRTVVAVGSTDIDVVVTDGLTHGDTVWEHDSAYVELRDDFVPNWANNFGVSGTNSMGAGELGWFINSAPASVNQSGGAPPYLGQLSFDNGNAVNQFSSILLNFFSNISTFGSSPSPSTISVNSFALLENPGWKLTWIFKWDGAVASVSGFDTTKKSCYVGLSGSYVSNIGTQVITPRPDIFIGLRYDTSITPGTLTLTSVANAGAGVTVYTGTITGGLNGAYIGMTFVVAGFTNGVNNGTFVCSQSTATTLTLGNASGAAETHAATAAGPAGMNDAFFTFEAVLNPQYSSGARHNLQGQTHVTTVAPAMGVWHRLDMTCSAAGVIVMTLDGSSTNTFTVTVPTMTITMNGGQASCNNHSARVATGGAGTSGGRAYLPFANGSVVTTSIPGFATLSSTQALFFCDGVTLRWDAPTVGNIGNSSVFPDGTISGYPALTPVCTFGNDDTASPTSAQTRFTVDFFSLVWNPNLGASAPGTPDATKARYW